MKGFFNKFKDLKDQVKDLIKNLDIETASPGVVSGVTSDVSGTNIDSEEMVKRRVSMDSKKFKPKTREEIIKDWTDTDKFFKLFQTMETHLENKDEDYENTNFEIYYKGQARSISSIFYEKVQNSEKIDIASQEIFDLITSSQESTIKDNKPLILISIIGFHHKKGTVLEYSYPNLSNELGFTKELASFIEQSLLTAGMPDAVHNAPEDFVYFTINLNKSQLENLSHESLAKISQEGVPSHLVLYGISFFKQIPVTESMKKRDPELIRSHVQKAVCILSKAPIFGHILAKLDPVTKCYFRQDDFEDTQILRNAYDSLNTSLKDVNINSNELLAGVCVKKLIYFLKDKVMTLWKAIFLEKKVLIYSQHPSACSTFIHSLLALFPCLCHFTYQNKALNLTENHYNEYGLPLRFFHDKCLLIPYFSVQHLDSVILAQGFLAGTSNPLIKTLPKVNWDILIDIDQNSMQIKNDPFKKLLSLTKLDKEFIQGIMQTVKSNNASENLSWKNIVEVSVFNDVDMVYEGSEDWIMYNNKSIFKVKNFRQKFYNYLKTFITEVELFRYRCSDQNLGTYHIRNPYKLFIGKIIEHFNSELAKKAHADYDPSKMSPGILRSNTGPEKKFEYDILAQRKQSSDEREESDKNSEEANSASKKGGLESELISSEETKDTSEDSTKVHHLEEEKVERRERFVSYDEPKGDLGDPKNLLKWEGTYLKETVKTLKTYGIEWILEWIKTRNFKYWLHNHEPMIGQRSVNNLHARNHLWYYENGDIYFGDLKEGRRNGRGQFSNRAAKLIYRGEWENDIKSGEGILSSIGNNDFLYDGSFKNNQKEGYGRLIQGKERYVGTFKKDRFDGNGVLVDKDQNIYEGDFKGGYKWGMGKFQLANGNLYLGEFAKDLYHGRGQMIYKNGDIYSGTFQEGKKSGKGIFQFASGDLYEGHFKNNLFNGRGKLTLKDGTTFEGVFDHDKLAEGEEGIINYPDGSRYEGVICGYKAHGYGVLTKKNPEGDEIIVKGRFEHDQLVEELKDEDEEEEVEEEEKPEEKQEDQKPEESYEVVEDVKEAPSEQGKFSLM